MRKLTVYILLLIVAALLSACGGGQSPSSSNSIKAVIKTSSNAVSANVAGIDLTISIPYGVSPPLLTDGKVDVAATVSITSSTTSDQTLPGVVYTPATATASGQLRITAIVASGFTTSDQVTLNLEIASGTTPTAADFSLLAFSAYDKDGNAVTGLSPSLDVSIQ